MEIAIPLVALGGLYIMSNQSKKGVPATNGKEGFTPGYEGALPNINVPNTNYPNEYPVENATMNLTSQLSNVNKYDGQQVYTDKFFNPNSPDSLLANTGGEGASQGAYYSLNGDKVGSDYFTHNNMQPFFGSHLRTIRTDANVTESVMDSYTGAGSQTMRKTERAPLFAPDENYQYAFGAPNQSDFYQSRVNPSLKMSNVKPFAEQRVGPGLGAGYSTEGVGGYNSGLMARDMYLEKTVDELRVANKPKAGGIGTLGYEGPAGAQVSNRGMIGIQNKNGVDTSFEMGRDRLFTSVGDSKAPTARAIPVERHVNRPETCVDYVGGAGAGKEGFTQGGEYMPSKHIDLGAVPLAPACHIGVRGPNEADYGMKSKMIYQNNRSANKQDDYFGIAGGVLKSAVAPLLDMLRPSRRENTIGTLRPYQNAKATVSNSYVLNPADRPVTTIRETTEIGKGHLFIDANQRGGAYKVTPQQLSNTNRQEQSDFYYAGIGGGGDGNRQPRMYDAEYNQTSNGLKSSTLAGYTPAGSMSLLNSKMNITAKDKNYYLENNRALDPTFKGQTPSYGAMGQQSTAQTQNLYQNIQLDRNDGGILNQLKGNPFAISHLTGL